MNHSFTFRESCMTNIILSWFWKIVCLKWCYGPNSATLPLKTVYKKMVGDPSINITNTFIWRHTLMSTSIAAALLIIWTVTVIETHLDTRSYSKLFWTRSGLFCYTNIWHRDQSLNAEWLCIYKKANIVH